MPKARLWKVGDRLVHRSLDTLKATVQEFRKDSFFHSGYYCKIAESSGRESSGDWGMIREDWRLPTGPTAGNAKLHINLRIPAELLEKVDLLADERGCDRTSIILDAIRKL